MYDPELPAGFQDADFEMRELEAAARHAEAERKAGRCTHSWYQGPYAGEGIHHHWQGPKDAPIGSYICFHCNTVLGSDPHP